MGGAAPVPSGKGGKKSLDSELNLVPFIDLLSCLISFLLITAVWTQITSIKVTQTGGLSEDTTPPPPDETTIDVKVTLTDRGYVLSLAGKPEELPKAMVEKKGPEGKGVVNEIGFDTKALGEKLKLVKAQFTAQRAVTVAADDAVKFDDLILTIDSIVALDLPDISVTTAVN